MRPLLLLSLFVALLGPATESRAQTWARGYIGDASEEFLDVVVTLGESTVFAGYTTSFGEGGRDGTAYGKIPISWYDIATFLIATTMAAVRRSTSAPRWVCISLISR